MNKTLKKYLVFVLLTAVGVISALAVLMGRSAIEEDNRQYDIVMDYSSLEEMCDQSPEDMDFWLDFFHKQGINKVALYETSVKSLAEDPGSSIFCSTSADITSEYKWEDKYPDKVAELISASEYPTDTLVASTDRKSFEWVVSAFKNRADNITCEVIDDGDSFYLWIYGNKAGVSGKMWTEFCLGIWPETAEKVLSYGYDIIPRSSAKDNMNGEKYANGLFDSLVEYGSPYFIPGGDALPGYDAPASGSVLLRDFLNDNGVVFGLIETAEQSRNIDFGGMNEIIESTDYGAVRVFSMWPYIQSRYAKYGYTGPEEITNSLFRATYERSCRIIYLKMMYETDSEENYIVDPDDYAKLLSDFYSRMGERSFTYETISADKGYVPSTALRLLIGVGAIAACVLLLNMFIECSTKVNFILFILGVIAMAGATFVMPNTSKLILSIGGGIVMPSLAAVGINRYLAVFSKNDRFKPGFIKLLIFILSAVAALFLISLCGSFFAAAPLSESAFMLELSLYRGVKFMQLIPLCIYLVSFMQVFVWEKYYCKNVRDLDTFGERLERYKGTWSEVLDTPIHFRAVVYAAVTFLVICVLGVCGYYYIQRTGNSDKVSVSVFEIAFRNYLENTLAARPRNKEFLVGYPCIMLMIWCCVRRIKVLPLIFGIGAVIGAYVSIVNTFLHIHTLFLISIVRELIGLGFGAVLGVIAVIIAEIIYKIAKRQVLKNV